MNHQRLTRPLVLAACLGLVATALIPGCASSAPLPFHELADAVLLASARRDLDSDEPKTALAKCEALVDRPSARAEREDAIFLQAVCRLRMEDYEAAFEDLKAFVGAYPLSKHRAEDPLFHIGVSVIEGSDSGFLGLRGFLGLSLEGVEVLRYLVKISPNGKHAADAQRIVAQYYFDTGDFELAQLEYEAFLADHPKGRWRPLAEYRIPLCRLKRSRGADYDRSLLEKARTGFQDYERKHPDGDFANLSRNHVSEINELMAEKNFRIGTFYLADKRVDASVFHFRLTQYKYPESRWARLALGQLRQIAIDYPESPAGRAAAAVLEREEG